MKLIEFKKILEKYNLLNEKIILDSLKFVSSHLSEIKADDGSSQIEQHIYPVAYEVIQYLNSEGYIDPEIVAVALLHDVIEDNYTIQKDMLQEIFGSRVTNDVKMLTKNDWHLMQGIDERAKKVNRDKEYFNRLKKAPNEVITVKLADRLNNLSRLNTTKEIGKKETYIKETVEEILPLAESHSTYFSDKIKIKLSEL